MIVTIQTASAKALGIGLFEAMKHGLEADPYADNSFDLTVQDMKKVDSILGYCGGKVVAVVDRREE